MTQRYSQQIVDLSHTVEHGMVTCQGLPAPVICDYLSREASRARYASGTEFEIGRITMVGNTGTYVDSPFHRYPDRMDLADLPLTSLADLPCTVVRVSSAAGRAITELPVAANDICGHAVLVHTGWDRHWGTERYFEGHPFLSAAAAQQLADARVALVGIDSLNIDCTDDGERPAHSVLLRSDIPIVEHLCGLDILPDSGARFFAVPVKVRAFATFPVRAFAVLERQ